METRTQDITLQLERQPHAGILRLPADCTGLVLFAHGSGSSRLSGRNNHVADILYEAGIGSLLFDLLTAQEDQIYRNRFDMDLLARRLLAATEGVRDQPGYGALPLGYFGASTGAAAALKAAAAQGTAIRAVVSRGGRPDLAGDDLPRVRSPTLLIVGGLDDVVIDLNQSACARMQTTCTLEIVSGATHLFEEPGTLDQAAHLATRWFGEYLTHST